MPHASRTSQREQTRSPPSGGGDDFFMAQNYIKALDSVVKIHEEMRAGERHEQMDPTTGVGVPMPDLGLVTTRMTVTLALVALLVVGCDSEPDPAPRSGRAPAASGVPDRRSPLTFPVQRPSRVSMHALLQGTLVRRHQCLYVVTDESKRTILPIWPHGFSYRTADDRIVVLDKAGAPVFSVGRRVSMGGGLVGEPSGDAALPDDLRERVAECDGPYWIVADVR